MVKILYTSKSNTFPQLFELSCVGLRKSHTTTLKLLKVLTAFLLDVNKWNPMIRTVTLFTTFGFMVPTY